MCSNFSQARKKPYLEEGQGRFPFKENRPPSGWRCDLFYGGPIEFLDMQSF
jgi:hypothetical protein